VTDWPADLARLARTFYAWEFQLACEGATMVGVDRRLGLGGKASDYFLPDPLGTHEAEG